MSNQWIDAVKRFIHTMVCYVAFKFVIVYELMMSNYIISAMLVYVAIQNNGNIPLQQPNIRINTIYYTILYYTVIYYTIHYNIHVI